MQIMGSPAPPVSISGSEVRVQASGFVMSRWSEHHPLRNTALDMSGPLVSVCLGHCMVLGKPGQMVTLNICKFRLFGNPRDQLPGLQVRSLILSSCLPYFLR